MLLQLFSLLNKRGGSRLDCVNLGLSFSDGLCGSIDGSLQISGLSGEGLDFSGDFRFLLFKVSLLLFDESSELGFSFFSHSIFFFTSFKALFFLTSDGLNELIFHFLNLSLDISDLVANSGGLLGDFLSLNFFSFNLSLNKGNSLLSLFSDTRRLLLLELGLVDFSGFGSRNRLLLLLSQNFLCFFNKNSLFFSLSFLDLLSLNLDLSDQS